MGTETLADRASGGFRRSRRDPSQFLDAGGLPLNDQGGLVVKVQDGTLAATDARGRLTTVTAGTGVDARTTTLGYVWVWGVKTTSEA